jgi:hypothetical protein
VELPRYTSRALPQVTAQSPAEAAAGASATAQALANGLDVVANVTSMIGRAEGEAAAGAALADMQAELNEFAADPRWQQPETNGRPTAEVLAEEWTKKQREVLARKPAIGWRESRNQFEQRRKLLVSQAGVEVIGQQRRLQVDRGRSLTDFAARTYINSGDYASARDELARGIQDGLYTIAEYVQRSQELDQQQVEDGYLRQIAPGADSDLGKTVMDVLGDARLPPARRNVLARTISAEAERRSRSEDADRKAFRESNAALAWRNVDNLTTDQIMGLDLTPEDRTTLVRFKRDSLLEGVDNPEAIANVTRTMAGLSSGDSTRDDVQATISQELAAGRLSAQSAMKFQSGLASTADTAWRDPKFSDLMREGELAINDGVPSESLLNIYAQAEAKQRSALASEWRRAFLDAKMAAGPGFDAELFYRQNLTPFMDRAKRIVSQDQSAEFGRFRVQNPQGGMDYNKTKAAIDDAMRRNEITPKQHQDAYKHFGMDK